ncbi:MAG: hypothetical protein JO041_11010 [Acidobacteria bacterium]|nr:hypothetical protein [Acidobacteriota bacterium]
MGNVSFFVLGVLGLPAFYLAVEGVLKFRRVHGPRLVTCPADGKPAGVRLDTGSAALAALFGAELFHLSACSNWPQRAGCAQRCLAEIENAPQGCLVRNIVAEWYRGKECVFCHRVFGEIDWLNKPALLEEHHGTRQWSNVTVEELPKVLGQSQPVCWNCHILQTLCSRHPEMVTPRIGAE